MEHPSNETRLPELEAPTERPVVIEFADHDGARITLLVDSIESVREVPDPDGPYTHIRTKSGDTHNTFVKYAVMTAALRAHANATNPID